MAPPKRKRPSTRPKANKRPKYTEPSDSDSEQLYEAECILDERRVRGKLQYLIRWKGIDPKTGEEYPDEWQPAENANEALLASWIREKASRGSRTGGRPKKQAQQQARPARKSRVIESSPEPSTAHSSTVPSRASSTSRAHPDVLIQKPSDFDPDEYERYSQLTASTSPSRRSDTEGTDLDSSQLFAAAPQYHSSGVVQDSQSSAGEGSFVPATQQTTGTTQQSSAADGSQEEVTEDSVRSHRARVGTDVFANASFQGLLEIVQEAASRAHSPARSIPETLYDTTADSQSQRRREASRERTEVPDTLELADESSLFIPEHEHLEDDEEDHLQEGLQAVAHEETAQQDSSGPQEHVSPTYPEPTTPELAPVSFIHITRPESQQQDELNSAIGASVDEAQAPQATHSTNTTSEASLTPDKSQTIAEDGEITAAKQHTESGVVETTSSSPKQVGSQDKDQASLTEHSEQDDAAQFPFHSQHPLHIQSPPQATTRQSVREDFETSIETGDIPAEPATSEQAGQREAVHVGLSTVCSTQASTINEPLQPQAASSLLVSSTQAEDDELLSAFLEPEYIRSQSPPAAQPIEVVEETVIQSTYASHSIEEESVRRRDFALESQAPRSTDQSTASREQNAQVVPTNNDLSTQEDPTESVRPSIEKEDVPGHSSPASRHDSSQETPERRLSSVDHSSSPIPQPPDHSLGTLGSVPSRPRTPVPTSSLSIMASQDTGKAVEERLKALLKEKEAQNPFTPTRRMRKSAVSPSSAVAMPTASPSTITSSRRLLRTGASPSAAAVEGTRSPSTVPDRSPAPPAPTSLRTVALTHTSQPPTEETREETVKALSVGPPLEIVEEIAPKVPAIVTTEPTVPEDVSSDEMDLSDGDADDDDTASLLNDDLQLAVEEYVVPLFIEGRQSDMYSAYIKQKNEVLDSFLKDTNGVQTLEQIEEVLSHLRAIETHIDLVFAEAGSVCEPANSATQAEFAAQFGMENSTKFRFLHWLFHTLRNHEKHVVLVVEEDNDALLNVIETFLKANFIRYSMPTRGLESDPNECEGSLLVSIFPGSTSPIIRPANVIVCLDGVQDASHIRQKNWAANPDLEVVPILHLVIPRTVGHIERYLSSALDKRERIHTILASLAQMRGELGKPIDEATPRAPRAACMVADWLNAAPEDRGPWPLISIGSVKDVIEYQTQTSPTSAASPVPVPERAKRPHDDEELDPAKRMRFTPQPEAIPGSSLNENEITRISDSMPGTATDDAFALRAQLVRLEEAYKNERAAREADKARFSEKEVMWVKQQTVHEDLTKQYRLLLGKQQSTEQKLDTTTKNNETLRERLATRTTELQTLTSQLDEQRATHLLSDDEKVGEITKLRKDLALANEEKARAVKAQESVDKMLDYTKEEYRKASDAAGSSKAVIADLEAQNAHLAHAASGQPAALKKLHLDRQYDNMAIQVRNLKSETATLKKALSQKEDELQRAKLSGERMGVRTRGTSATPQPNKVRSRAASPLGGRLSNLRNG